MKGVVWYLTLMATTLGADIEKCDYSDPKKVPIRLASLKGTHLPQGRLQGCTEEREWGSACVSYQLKNTFSKANSEVICYQLGWAGSSVNNYWRYCEGDSECGTDPPWIKSVNCTGDEEYLGQCSITSGSCTDSHKRNIIVNCANDLQARLEDTKLIDHQGVLAYYFNQTWGGVCASGWTEQNAQVICNQLGLGAAIQNGSYPFAEGKSRFSTFLATDVNCRGNETKLSLCSRSLWATSTTCQEPMTPIWVKCTGPIPDNLAVVSTNSDSVTLTWSVPAQLDYYAVIYGYSVEYTSEHSGTKTYHSQSISTNPTVTIPALDPKIGYTFKVAVAFDPELANVGPYSKSIEKETDARPPILVALAAFFGTLSLLFGSCCCLLLCCVYRPKCGWCWYRRFENGKQKKFFRCPFERRDSPCPCDPFECCKCYDANFRERKDRRKRILNGGYVQIEGHDGDED